MNIKAESYNKPISKKTFHKNSTSSFVAQTNPRSETRGNSSSVLNASSNVSSPNKNFSVSLQGNASSIKRNVRSTILCPMKHTGCQSRSLQYCPHFKKLSVKDRREAARKLRVCFTCLAKGHSATACKNSSKCRFCSSLHNELLCGSVRNTHNLCMTKSLKLRT